MGIRDVPIPERIGEKIPCERCYNMPISETVKGFCDSYKYGHMSEEEIRAILEESAKESRLHPECAVSLIESVMRHYRPKRKK